MNLVVAINYGRSKPTEVPDGFATSTVAGGEA